MSSNGNTLLVEGRDDLHVVENLLKHHAYSGQVEIVDSNGVENLLKTISVRLKSSEMKTLGIMFDADTAIQARWAKLRETLKNFGYEDIPDKPTQGGTVIRQELLPTFGVWVMPDNSSPGMLEDFIAHLVPTDDKVFIAARLAVDSAARIPAPFQANHLSKAEIHTWLAWQSDPGTPLGLAITKKYLNPDAESAQKFMSWVKILFSL